MKRETLIRNVQEAIVRSQKEVLLATIREVYAFGGILRDKERMHDFDVVFLYEQTPKQKAEWHWFIRCFGELRDPIARELDSIRKDVYDILWPYRGWYRMEGVKGYAFYHVYKPIQITDLRINGKVLMTDEPINWLGMQALAEHSQGKVFSFSHFLMGFRKYSFAINLSLS